MYSRLYDCCTRSCTYAVQSLYPELYCSLRGKDGTVPSEAAAALIPSRVIKPSLPELWNSLPLVAWINNM
ncbi:MAG: hypothetical protein LBK58_10920 [Prevotellaceae bacterium]|nr:hypothetical protein [Prevotellaceae bacterium]